MIQKMQFTYSYVYACVSVCLCKHIKHLHHFSLYEHFRDVELIVVGGVVFPFFK